MTPDERSMAKMVNFGIAYGMSDFGLVQPGRHPAPGGAATFINRYFATYSGISYYMIHIKETARAQGFVTTLLGRRREIPELQVAQPRRCVAAGERMAINMPIQGTAADIMKIAMIRVAERLRARGLPAPGSSSRSTTSCSSRCRGTRWSASCPSSARRWRARCRSTSRSTVDVKVGGDWESMTPSAPRGR